MDSHARNLAEGERIESEIEKKRRDEGGMTFSSM